MRRFWLKNGDKLWDLTTKNTDITSGNFLGSIDGLGIKIKVDAFEIERAFFIENVELENSDISGKLYFIDYNHFNNFVEFLGLVETDKTLKLFYSTDDKIAFNEKEMWYKDVIITELKKSEIEFKTSCLTCTVKFKSLSRWKKDKTITLTLSPSGTALVYPYFYPYVYGGQNNMAVEIDNSNNLPTSVIVKIEAETDTPLFRIIQNNKIISQAKYHVIVRENTYMLIDSSPNNQEASLYTSAGREDIYYLGERDYTYSNFIFLPEGKSMFLFTASNSDFGKVTLEYSLQRTLL